MDRMVQESIEHMQIEDEKTSIIAQKRLEEILANPTMNFYEKYIYHSKDISENKNINLKK